TALVADLMERRFRRPRLLGRGVRQPAEQQNRKGQQTHGKAHGKPSPAEKVGANARIVPDASLLYLQNRHSETGRDRDSRMSCGNSGPPVLRRNGTKIASCGCAKPQSSAKGRTSDASTAIHD